MGDNMVKYENIIKTYENNKLEICEILRFLNIEYNMFINFQDLCEYVQENIPNFNELDKYIIKKLFLNKTDIIFIDTIYSDIFNDSIYIDLYEHYEDKCAYKIYICTLIDELIDSIRWYSSYDYENEYINNETELIDFKQTYQLMSYILKTFNSNLKNKELSYDTLNENNEHITIYPILNIIINNDKYTIEQII